MKKAKTILLTLLLISLSVFGYIKYQGLNKNDLVLKSLNRIKKLRGQSVDLTDISKVNTPQISHSTWSELLQNHVDKEGKVDYRGFLQDRNKFNQYLSTISNNPPGLTWSDSEALAYWINAYNAYTIKLILDHYPINSIKEISDGLPMINSPWDIKFFQIANTDFDLNTIEHEILRKKFDEPRMHFAINCASISCPKLRNEAYTPEKLESQLEEQAFGFINNINSNVINLNEIKLSRIFDWFQSDFSKNESLLSFIKRYNPHLDENIKVTYLEYNWSLNE